MFRGGYAWGKGGGVMMEDAVKDGYSSGEKIVVCMQVFARRKTDSTKENCTVEYSNTFR